MEKFCNFPYYDRVDSNTSPAAAKAVPIRSAFPLLEEWQSRVRAAVPNYERANGEGATAAMADRLSASTALSAPA